MLYSICIRASAMQRGSGSLQESLVHFSAMTPFLGFVYRYLLPAWLTRIFPLLKLHAWGLRAELRARPLPPTAQPGTVQQQSCSCQPQLRVALPDTPGQLVGCAVGMGLCTHPCYLAELQISTLSI